MRIKLLIFLVALSAISAVSLSAANPYASRTARGIAIYKANAFQSDDSAVIVEYLTHQDYPALTVFHTASGQRVTVPMTKSEVMFLPYPGKGEATPEDALVVINMARTRFPQFRDHYLALTRAWRDEARRPRAEIEADLARRAKNKSTGDGFGAWLRSLSPKLPPPKLPKSPLGNAESDAAKDKESSGGDQTAKPADSASSTGTTDLQRNLETIKQFYEMQKQLEAGQ